MDSHRQGARDLLVRASLGGQLRHPPLGCGQLPARPAWADAGELVSGTVGPESRTHVVKERQRLGERLARRALAPPAAPDTSLHQEGLRELERQPWPRAREMRL